MISTSPNGQLVGGHGNAPIAQAWLTVTSASTTEGRSYTARSTDRSIPSSPGRWVQFRSGYSVIRDERDLIACLRLEGCTISVEPTFVDWFAAVLNRCGPIPPVAEIQLPRGFAIEGEPGAYVLLRDTEGAPATFRLVREVPPTPLSPAEPAPQARSKVDHDAPGHHCVQCNMRKKREREMIEAAAENWRPPQAAQETDSPPVAPTAPEPAKPRALWERVGLRRLTPDSSPLSPTDPEDKP